MAGSAASAPRRKVTIRRAAWAATNAEAAIQKIA
jgi:hypothetical protein